jgi:hypothetical protein
MPVCCIYRCGFSGKFCLGDLSLLCSLFDFRYCLLELLRDLGPLCFPRSELLLGDCQKSLLLLRFFFRLVDLSLGHFDRRTRLSHFTLQFAYFFLVTKQALLHLSLFYSDRTEVALSANELPFSFLNLR